MQNKPFRISDLKVEIAGDDAIIREFLGKPSFAPTVTVHTIDQEAEEILKLYLKQIAELQEAVNKLSILSAEMEDIASQSSELLTKIVNKQGLRDTEDYEELSHLRYKFSELLRRRAIGKS